MGLVFEKSEQKNGLVFANKLSLRNVPGMYQPGDLITRIKKKARLDLLLASKCPLYSRSEWHMCHNTYQVIRKVRSCFFFFFSYFFVWGSPRRGRPYAHRLSQGRLQQHPTGYEAHRWLHPLQHARPPGGGRGTRVEPRRSTSSRRTAADTIGGETVSGFERRERHSPCLGVGG